jgi:hypothetical protein
MRAAFNARPSAVNRSSFTAGIPASGALSPACARGQIQVLDETPDFLDGGLPRLALDDIPPGAAALRQARE